VLFNSQLRGCLVAKTPISKAFSDFCDKKREIFMGKILSGIAGFFLEDAVWVSNSGGVSFLTPFCARH
jgi:hypothetical protein